MGEKKDIHLVVLAHGLWGNAGHLKFIAEQLKKKYPGEIHLIQDEYETISKTSKVTKFSIIGYSLGGLFSRYVIGRLFKDGFFDKVKPVLFATFATPHLGVYRPHGTPLSAVFNWMSARILSRTGEQLQCCDEYRDGKPMLVVLSDP
ncbi:putative serine esterase-domain-containing protein, partial [Jimgerdemannia flammicorona]